MKKLLTISACLSIIIPCCLSPYQVSAETKALQMKPQQRQSQRAVIPRSKLKQIHPRILSAYPQSTKVLRTDNFTKGSTKDWELEPGWYIKQEKGRNLLKGQGHYWARLKKGEEWSNYTMRTRFKLIRGIIHFNFRVSDRGRYFVGVGEHFVSLQKESPWKKFDNLKGRRARIELNVWHDIKIDIYKNHIRIIIDGNTKIAFTDKLPLRQGGIAFETLKDSESWIDHVSVYQLPLQKPLMLSNQIMQIPRFSLPPPEASVWEVLPNEFFFDTNKQSVKLADVDRTLVGALNSAGYTSKAYYLLERENLIVDGFALVTKMEQINEDGTSKSRPHRWAPDVLPMRGFSVKELIRRLFSAEAGHFRIIVFVVTAESFSQSDPVSRDVAIDWLKNGINKLPPAIGNKKYSDEFNCTALIYQFEKEKGAPEKDAKLIDGFLTCRDHLTKAKLWEVWKHD